MKFCRFFFSVSKKKYIVQLEWIIYSNCTQTRLFVRYLHHIHSCCTNYFLLIVQIKCVYKKMLPCLIGNIGVAKTQYLHMTANLQLRHWKLGSLFFFIWRPWYPWTSTDAANRRNLISLLIILRIFFDSFLPFKYPPSRGQATPWVMPPPFLVCSPLETALNTSRHYHNKSEENLLSFF